jgi:uncharacterized protein (TIRG00374 family)
MNVPLMHLYALYLVGKFFNNFMPSNVGGDLVRGYELGTYTKNGASAMASIFVERFTGFVVLVVMAALSLLNHRRLFNEPALTLAVGTALVGLVCLLWLILDSRSLTFLTRFLKIPIVHRHVPTLQRFQNSVHTYRTRPGTLPVAFFWSFVFMLLAIVNIYCTARVVYSPVSLPGIAVVVPVIFVVAMLPLTFNGLGTQEWAFVLLFSWIGLPASVGLSTIVLMRAKDLMVGIVGGILYPLIRTRNEKALT